MQLRLSARRLWVPLAMIVATCPVPRVDGQPVPPQEQAKPTPLQTESAVLDSSIKSLGESVAATYVTIHKHFAAENSSEPATPAVVAAPSATPQPNISEVVAKGQFGAAQNSLHQAIELQRQAETYATSNPAYAEHLKHLAQDQIDVGQRYLQKAHESLDGPGNPGAQPGFAAGNITTNDGCRQDCHLAKIIALAGPDREASLHLFDGAPTNAPPEPVAPPSNTYLNGSFSLNNGGTALNLPGGQTLDLGPLHDAVVAAVPEMADKREVTTCGTQHVPCLSADFLRLLADPQLSEKLKSIGGVALAATFDVMAVAGISDVRGGPDIRLVENPMLISLKRLLAAVEAWRGPNAWAQLPDNLRFPGGVDRITGFILDPDNGDIVLVGRPAKFADARIDIDEIMIAVRTVWRDGLTPGVSLDPRPDDIGGPQYPRVIDTPPDSVVAKIMLEADYAMKAISQDAGFAHGKGLINNAALIRANLSDRQVLYRLWLTPRYLSSKAIYRSMSGRTVLLDTNVEIRTEEMIVGNNALEGTGSVSGVGAAQAQAMTDAYGSFETSGAIQPSHVFARLHGLVDLVTMAKIWRAEAINAPVLADVAALPYRALTGAEALPSSYPGLNSTIDLGDGRIFGVKGGVQLMLRLRSNSAQTFNDHISQTLQDSLSDLRRSGTFAIPVSLVFGLPVAATTGDRETNQTRLSAERAFERRDYESAEAKLREVLATDRNAPDVYAGLAQVWLAQDRTQDAAAVIATALQLAPGDEDLQTLAMDVAWRKDQRAAYAAFTETDRHQLSRYYARLADIAAAQRRPADVQRFAGWATDNWEDNGDALITLAFSYPDGNPRRNVYLARSVRAYRRQLTGGVEEARKPLAVALTISANQHLGAALDRYGALTAASNGQMIDGGVVTKLLTQALAEAQEAVEVDPRQPIAAGLAILADGYLALITPPGGRPSAETISKSDALVEQFPQDPGVYLTRAMIMSMAGAPEKAARDLDQAERIAPLYPLVFITRAAIKADNGDCAGAAVSLDEARHLLGADADRVLGMQSEVSACKPRPSPAP